MGGGAWQPPGECPRSAARPAPPLTRASLPLLLWRGGEAGALDPDRGKRPESRGGGRGRGPGPACFCPFWRRSSGRCPLLPLGPERRVGFCGGPSPARPVPQDCSWLAREGGQARGRGARSPGGAAVLGAGREAWMDFTARVIACVCSRQRPGPARPVRPPRASEVRVPGPESGGGDREGAGEGHGGGAITPSPPPAGSTRASRGARTTPASWACPRLFPCRRRGGAGPILRPPAGPRGEATGGGGCQSARPRVLPGSGRRRAERGRAAEGARRPPGRAVLGRAVPGLAAAAAAAARKGRRRAQGRSQPAGRARARGRGLAGRPDR